MLKAIKKQEVGRFSVGSNVGVDLNVVRESVSGRAAQNFYRFRTLDAVCRIRGGYRSIDYPFGVIEMTIDEAPAKAKEPISPPPKSVGRTDKKTINIR